GIRDLTVTGVQTCALPISLAFVPPLAQVLALPLAPASLPPFAQASFPAAVRACLARSSEALAARSSTARLQLEDEAAALPLPARSEERRVGKECRCVGGRV